MIERIENRYQPDYAVHPGEILSEYLEVSGMTQKELAERTGLTPKTINEIVQGKAPVTPDTAIKFERVFGRPAHYWSGLQREYDETQARRADRKGLQSSLKWLKRVPIKEMGRLGWLEVSKDPMQQLEHVLGFFGVASPDQLKMYQAAFRQTKRFTVHEEAVWAWLRRGEIEAQSIQTQPYDKARFRGVLTEVRALTRELPEVFQPQLVELCARAGVAVVFIPELPKTGASGATRWLSPEKALIQLSLRYKTDDHLWFTFFHEAMHVLHHSRKAVFLEGKGLDGEDEEEANRLAADFLIPPSELRAFLQTAPVTPQRIVAFAHKLGIAPGIVLGRLQHDGIVGHNFGNVLRRRFDWKLTATH